MTKITELETAGTAYYCLEDSSKIKAVRHINPDGSVGGWVPENSNIPQSVSLDRRSVVLPGAKVSPMFHNDEPALIS